MSILAAIDIPGMVEAAGSATHFLAVQRYDREANARVHVEDACQALGLMPNRKYASENPFHRAPSARVAKESPKRSSPPLHVPLS
jgi:hypothetical protein